MEELDLLLVLDADRDRLAVGRHGDAVGARADLVAFLLLHGRQVHQRHGGVLGVDDVDEGRRRLTLGVSEQGVAEDEGADDGGGTGEEIAACVHGVLLS